MIPKIFPSYEKKEYKKIPTNYDKIGAMMKYFHIEYLATIKGSTLKIKFCTTCLIYRPPRTVHCEIFIIIINCLIPSRRQRRTLINFFVVIHCHISD